MFDKVFKSKLSHDELRLLSAAESGNLALVKALCADGISPNTKDDRCVPWHATPIMMASYGGHIDVVRELIAAGANVNAKDKCTTGEGGHSTALHFAARGKHPEVIRELVRSGATINAMNHGEGTPLHYAAMRKPQHIDIDFNQTNISDQIRDWKEVPPNPEEIREIQSTLLTLLDLGADPNLPCRGTGASPLDCAVSEGLYDAARLLLERGANPLWVRSHGLGSHGPSDSKRSA